MKRLKQYFVAVAVPTLGALSFIATGSYPRGYTPEAYVNFYQLGQYCPGVGRTSEMQHNCEDHIRKQQIIAFSEIQKIEDITQLEKEYCRASSDNLPLATLIKKDAKACFHATGGKKSYSYGLIRAVMQEFVRATDNNMEDFSPK